MAQQSRLGRTATTVATIHGMTCVTYHSTVVVAFDEETITLQSGGWRTATTKTRMNQASAQFGLGFTVYQEDFEWFVSHCQETVPFVDGMVLQRKGPE